MSKTNVAASQMEHQKKQKISTKNIILVGMFAALLGVMSQISIPMPSGVPITIQALAVALTGVILGWKLGPLAILVYILIGSVGVPVFSNFRGGLEVMLGVTGGYILGWPLMALLCGIRPKFTSKAANMATSLVLSLAGMMVMETIGNLRWVALSGDQTIAGVFAYAIVAFIPKDAILTVIAVAIGGQIRKVLVKAGYL